jgi:hypothetical protein
LYISLSGPVPLADVKVDVSLKGGNICGGFEMNMFKRGKGHGNGE